MTDPLPAFEGWSANALPRVRELKDIFEQVFVKSFDGFTASRREYHVFNFPPDIAAKVRAIISTFNQRDMVEFIEWILQYLDSEFFPFQFEALLEADYADNEFLDLLAAVVAYLKEAFNNISQVLNVHTNASEYRNRFGGLDLVKLLDKKSSEMLISEYDDRIMETVRRRVRFLRSRHFYHDSAFWNSISNTSLGKVARVLHRVPEAEQYGDFVLQYESELIVDITKFVNEIPLRICEKGFLLIMRKCIDIEASNYTTLINPDADIFDECHARILNLFRDQHTKRRRARIFKDTDSDLVNPEANFSAAYFRDLFTLYVFRIDSVIPGSLNKFSSMIQDSFVQVAKMLIRHSMDFASGPGPQSLESFGDCLQELSTRKKLIKARLSQISDHEELMKTLESNSSQLSLRGLSTLDYKEQMQRAENYAIKFLCDHSVKCADEQAALSLIVNYYFFIPQHARFMNDLYMKMRMTALKRIPLPLGRLEIFISSELVNRAVPKKVKSLIQDLNTSCGMGGNCGMFCDPLMCITSDTCLVTRSRYWSSGKDHGKLLRPSPQLASIHETIATHLEGNLDKDRRLIPMHCLSRVILKTTLYTKGREFTRLDMLQHQSMILQLCEEKGTIRISEIAKSMSAQNIDTENNRNRATTLIRSLVESLLCPYPLVKITLNVENDSEDAIVTINHEFAFDDEEVRIPGDHIFGEAEEGL